MKKQILDQLHQITSTSLQFTESDLDIFIPKTTEITATALRKGETYIIELNDQLFGNRLYNIEVIDKNNDMTKVNGVAVGDPTVSYFGWLANKDFNVVDRL